MDTKNQIKNIQDMDEPWTMWDIIWSLIPDKSDGKGWIYSDALLVVLFYTSFMVAPLLLPTYPSEPLANYKCHDLIVLMLRQVLPFILVITSVFIPWYFHAPLFRGIFGLASIISAMRMAQLRNALWTSDQLSEHRQFFEKKPSIFRVAFVQFYHDLRGVYPRNGKYLFFELMRNLSIVLSSFLICAILSNILSVDFISKYMTAELIHAKYLYLVLILSVTTVYFVGGIYIIDIFYRFLLIPFHHDVPCTMQSPWLSLSVSEFWGKRFNIATQSLIKQFVFIPMKALLLENLNVSKHYAIFMAQLLTFMFSSLWHFYPLYLIIKDVDISTISSTNNTDKGTIISTGLFLMSLYFIIQAFCILIEKNLQIEQHASKFIIRLWVFGYILLLSPLFIVPVLMGLRLYQ